MSLQCLDLWLCYLGQCRFMSSPKILEITPQCQRPIYRGATKRRSACLPGPTRQIINLYTDTHCFTQTTKKTKKVHLSLLSDNSTYNFLCIATSRFQFGQAALALNNLKPHWVSFTLPPTSNNILTIKIS